MPNSLKFKNVSNGMLIKHNFTAIVEVENDCSAAAPVRVQCGFAPPVIHHAAPGVSEHEFLIQHTDDDANSHMMTATLSYSGTVLVTISRQVVVDDANGVGE